MKKTELELREQTCTKQTELQGQVKPSIYHRTKRKDKTTYKETGVSKQTEHQRSVASYPKKQYNSNKTAVQELFKKPHIVTKTFQTPDIKLTVCNTDRKIMPLI